MSFIHEMSLSLAMPSCFTALEELLRSELMQKGMRGEEHDLRESRYVHSYILQKLPTKMCVPVRLSASL